MNVKFPCKALRTVVLILMTGCSTGGSNKYIVKTGDIYIVAGAYSGAATKVEYEYDLSELLHRTVWSEDEEIYVAAYSDGSRVNADGTIWSRFSTDVAETEFDKEYMLFSGFALTASDPEIVAEQRLYAIYPADVLCSDADNMVMMSASQHYSPRTFDTQALIMVSAPLGVTLPAEGTVHASAFRFRHHTGYLKLTFSGLPEDLATERISRITLRTAENMPVSGKFLATIDDQLGDWTFGPAGENSDTIELDFEDSDITVADLDECWFVMMPGEYGDVTIGIYTDEASKITMKRSGLSIESNVIHARNIRFGKDDLLQRAAEITLTGEDLNIPKSLQLGGNMVSGAKDGVMFSHRRTIYTTEKYIQLYSVSSGVGGQLGNTTPFPSPLRSVEICYLDKDTMLSKFVYAKLGTSATEYFDATTGTGEAIVLLYPPDGTDCRYFHIENKGSSNVRIKYIKITCAPD